MRVVVVGDVMLDRYTLTEPVKISDEAPVLVCRQTGTVDILGGAANVAANLVGLGFRDVTLLGAIGPDWAGDRLKELCVSAGVGQKLVTLREHKTTVKERIESLGQQVIRVDVEKSDPIAAGRLLPNVELIEVLNSTVDIIVISDYGKGVVSRQLIISLMQTFPKAQVYINGKPNNFEAYRSCRVVTFNRKEYAEIVARRATNSNPAYGISDIQSQLGAYAAVVTRGSEGIMAYTQEDELIQVGGLDVVPIDITGAGDVVLSAIVYAQSKGYTMQQTIELANRAGALKVLKDRTAVITEKELLDAKGY